MYIYICKYSYSASISLQNSYLQSRPENADMAMASSRQAEGDWDSFLKVPSHAGREVPTPTLQRWAARKWTLDICHKLRFHS